MVRAAVSALHRLARQPLLHFLVLGGALFAASRALDGGGGAAPPPPVGDAPGPRELLFRAALERGYHRTDPIVRRRLARDMRFLDPSDSRDDDALVDEALALGLHHGDLVVRRRLVQKMELLAWGRADAREPTEAELRAAFRDAPERYRYPPRVRLTHVYLSRDRRGEALEVDARALGARLRVMAPDDAPALGDPFLLGAHLPLLDEAGLAARLGPALARDALEAPVGAWTGPVRSAYGLHWLWLHERRPARQPAFSEVRDRVRERVRTRRREDALRALVADLRAEVGRAGSGP